MSRAPESRVGRWPISLMAFWAALLVTAGVALPRLFGTSVSIDEAYSMDTAGRSLAGTLHQASHFELQPPLYFLLLNLWLRVSHTPHFARLLSLGCVLLSLLLLYRLARRLGGDIGLAMLPLFAALTAPVAWSAVTARGYALTLLLLVACAHGFVGVWGTDRPGTRWDLPVFIGAGATAIYSFYYSGFAVAGLFAAALVTGRRRRELWLAAGCMTIAVLPLFPAALAQVGAHPTQPEGDVRQPQLSAFLVSRSLGLFFWTGQLRHPPGLLLLAAVALLIGWIRSREGPPRWSRQESMWLLAALVAWGLLLVVDLTGVALVLPRHREVVLPAALVFLATFLDRVRHRGRRRLAVALALLAFAGFFLSFQRNQDGFDWQAAARVVAANESSGEPIVVFTSDGVLPLRWHYRGINPLVPFPSVPDLQHYDPAERYLQDSLQVREGLESVVQPNQVFWLIQRQWLPQAAGDSLLAGYVARETTPLGEWKLSGLDVYRLRRRGN